MHQLIQVECIKYNIWLCQKNDIHNSQATQLTEKQFAFL